MPEQIAVAFQALAAKINRNDPVITLAKPVHVMGDFALARGMFHLAGNNKFADTFMMADEDGVGRENHIFKISDRINSLNLQSCLLQS
jgi:hypothetical protein